MNCIFRLQLTAVVVRGAAVVIPDLDLVVELSPLLFLCLMRKSIFFRRACYLALSSAEPCVLADDQESQQVAWGSAHSLTCMQTGEYDANKESDGAVILSTSRRHRGSRDSSFACTLFYTVRACMCFANDEFDGAGNAF